MSSGRRRKVARTLPQYYARSPRVAQVLQSTFEEDLPIDASKDFGASYVEYGKASELISKITATFIKTYGGPGFEGVWVIKPTPDGHYIFAGASTSFGVGTRPLLIMKLDDYGNVIWAKIVGGGGIEHVCEILFDSNGNYVFGASSSSFGAGDRDYMIMKMSPNGDILQAKTIGGPEYEITRGMAPTPDGGYILSGNTYSFGTPSPKPLIVKLSADLTLEWGKVIELPFSAEIYGPICNKDGDYVATGFTPEELEGRHVALLVKFDRHGNVIYFRQIWAEDHMLGFTIELMRNGDYLIGGITNALGAQATDMLVSQITDDGDIVKAMAIGGVGDDYIWRVRACKSGGYIFSGHSYSWPAITLLKLSETLDFEWLSLVGRPLPGLGYIYGNDCCETHDGEYMVSGWVSGIGAGDWDILIARVSRWGDIPFCGWAQKVTPNISSGTSQVSDITYSVRDVTDQLLVTSPTYQSITPNLTIGTVCILPGWLGFMEERM